MAAFVKTATNCVQRWGSSSPLSSAKLKIVQLELTLVAQGGSVNYIAADQLGFQKILRSTVAQKSDDASALPTAPSYDGTKLFFYNPAQATDALRADPADASGTFSVVLEGL